MVWSEGRTKKMEVISYTMESKGTIARQAGPLSARESTASGSSALV